MSKTLYEAQLEAREAARDLGYTIFKTWGLIRLVRWLGLMPKPWILEREAREQAASSDGEDAQATKGTGI